MAKRFQRLIAASKNNSDENNFYNDECYQSAHKPNAEA
jgi:hypothetical protein